MKNFEITFRCKRFIIPNNILYKTGYYVFVGIGLSLHWKFALALAIATWDGTARGLDEHQRACDEGKECGRKHPSCRGVASPARWFRENSWCSVREIQQHLSSNTGNIINTGQLLIYFIWISLVCFLENFMLTIMFAHIFLNHWFNHLKQLITKYY